MKIHGCIPPRQANRHSAIQNIVRLSWKYIALFHKASNRSQMNPVQVFKKKVLKTLFNS